MKAILCPRNGCNGLTRRQRATEMPTLVSSDQHTKTTLDVVFCDTGHIIEYVEQTVEISENAPIRED